METEKSAESADFFCCEKCNFICSKKYNYDRHNLTLKHSRKQNGNQLETQKMPFSQNHMCFCGREYSNRSGLWKHKKKCNYVLKNEMNEDLIETESKWNLTDLVLEVIKQNQELIMQNSENQKQNQELQKSLIDICKNGTMNQYNSINSHNKTFNLQFFLNETCKDAMNITDFANSIQLQLSDLENVGKNGFVAGISNIIIHNLKQLDVTQRPVHCSDHKRETIYVKLQDQWLNDSKENQQLKKVIGQIAHKNICMIPEWKAKYPDCIFSDSNKSDQYNHIIYESMSQNVLNSEKIIKKIAKEVVIEKTK
jgi:hypothetical protein